MHRKICKALKSRSALDKIQKSFLNFNFQYNF